MTYYVQQDSEVHIKRTLYYPRGHWRGFVNANEATKLMLIDDEWQLDEYIHTTHILYSRGFQPVKQSQNLDILLGI